MTKAVIIGAGFAGIEAAKILAEETVQLTVIDRCNHHLFQPLLYQVATAGLSPADIAMPVRSILSDMPNTEVLMAEVQGIDPERRVVRLDRAEEVPYDYLILAAGARHSYFGHPEWERFAPGLKRLEDATEIRRRILRAFEEAERSSIPSDRDAYLTFVIVGGGPTGVEVAGAIAELARYSLAKDFVRINPTLARIVIVEAGPRVLASFPETLSRKAQRALDRLGVKVRLKTRVTDVTASGVQLDGGERIHACTVIWAAGVQPSPLAKDLGAPLDHAGRVVVAPDLSVPGHPEIFVCGDLASVPWKPDITVPGQAPGAMQEGRQAARNVLRLIRGAPTRPFRYTDKGQLATIGRSKAIADIWGIELAGFVAWVIWLAVHITYLIGFKNRVLVLFQWAWSYLTFQKGTRLITDPAAVKTAGSKQY